MQIFKAFFKTVKKQLTSIMIYFLIFFFLTILLTNMGKEQVETTYKATKINVAVIDRDNTDLSQTLYDYIDANHTIVEIKDTKESMADELFYRNVEYVLIIKDGFEDNIKAGNCENILENYQISQSVSGVFVDSQIQQFLKILSTYVSSGFSTTEASKLSLDTSLISVDVALHNVSNTSDVRSSTYYFFSYIPYILICMLIVGLGAILITFREENLNARIQCSSLSITQRNITLTICSFIFCISCWSLFLILSLVMYNEDMFTAKGLLYAANSGIFMFVALSITYLVSYFVHTSGSLNMASNVIGLGMSFLGGIFVPLQYMSSSVVSFSRFLPTYWYVQANELIEKYNGTAEQLHTFWGYLGIESIFAMAIFAAALVASKVKRH